MWQSFNINEVARKLRTNLNYGLSREEAENIIENLDCININLDKEVL